MDDGSDNPAPWAGATSAPSAAISNLERLHRRYVPVRYKLMFVTMLAVGWTSFSVYLALPWIRDLSELLTMPLAWFIASGIALIPGFASAFLLGGLLLDRRPVFRPMPAPPPVTILIAAYNEEKTSATRWTRLRGNDTAGNLKFW